MEFDDSGWTGDGGFTPLLVEALQAIDAIVAVRVEDAPSSRVDAGYAFIANEVFVTFGTVTTTERSTRLGLFPTTRIVERRLMRLSDLALRLESAEGVGLPDYSDEGMLQYLRTERIVPPYQTKGVKVVEMVRIYETGGIPPRR